MPKQLTEAEKLLQLATIVLTDSGKWRKLLKALPFYLFSETKDNEQSIFGGMNRVLFRQRAHVACMVITNDKEGSNKGYPGAQAWTEGLRRVTSQIEICTVETREPLNTYSESLAFVQHARENRWKELVIMAPPFHQLRAFISVVSALTRFGPKDLRVYNQAGAALPWNEKVLHSQGALEATRRELIVTEARRVHQYHEKGDLVSVDETLEYLEWRDSE